MAYKQQKHLSETDFKILTYPFRRHTLHITSKTNINNDYTYAVIYKNNMLLFASWLQFILFRDRLTLIQQFVHVYFCI